jgi:hypothetical protein
VVTFAPVSRGRPDRWKPERPGGKIVNGRWRTVHWLDSDQTHQGHVRLEPNEFTVQRAKLYQYR